MPQIARNYWQHIRSFGGFARVSKHTSTYIIPPSPIYLPAPRRPFTIEVRTPTTHVITPAVYVFHDSVTDSTSTWSEEGYLSNDTLGNFASSTTQNYIELIFDTPITCDKIKLAAQLYVFTGGVVYYLDPVIVLDIYVGSSWVNVFTGSIAKYTNTVKTFTEAIISKIRFKSTQAYYNSPTDSALIQLYYAVPYRVRTVATTPSSLVAIMQDAFDVKLELAAGAADNIMFSLPADDPKLSYFDNHNYDIWVRDQNGDVLASGVMDIKEPDGDALKETLTLTGFMAQLKREYIDTYSNAYATMGTIMQELLDFQLSEKPIRMGTCEYTAAGAVSFADCSIYDALIQVWEFFSKDGYFEVDENRALHWRVIGAYAGQQIRYRKNLVSIKPKEDYQEHANKIYAYGRGTSGNVIKLSDTGFYSYDYVKDDTSIAAYGTLVDTITDNSIATAVQLYSWAANELAARKDPSNSYSVDMVNLHYQTGYEFNKLVFSEYYRLISEPLAINLETNIVAITYNDLSNPLDVSVELSGKTRLLTDTIADLQKRL